jgi:light-regulated signal transduction histidine kinase (bacteriophytochrome)
MSELDAKGRYLLDSVIENTKRMGQLIDDLLSFSRVERSDIMHSDINMTALAKSVAEELLSVDIQKKINVRVEILPNAQGDGSLLRQVWVNLLSNAVKFTLPKESGLIEVGASCEEREIVYFVKDTGVGFDSRYAQKLFGIFQRLHSAAAFEGTGVGLAIVQRIIERHGGRVWAEGSQGEGATFYFSLPNTKNQRG